MYAVLNQCVDAINVIGPDCSSWGLPARHTSMRSEINPLGRNGLAWVDTNNCLVSRPLSQTINIFAICCSVTFH